MKNTFLFTIIVPIYNVEKYLKTCLESIINQTYIDGYEVILINDGSTDGSLNIINDYKNKIKNCIVINRENKGLLYSRLEGVNKANGKYILFLDSDDYLSNEALNTYYMQLKENDYDIVRGNYFRFDENNIKEIIEFPKSYIINDYEIVDKYYKKLLTTNIFNNAVRQVIRKDIINVEEINTSVTMGEDIEFNQACYKNAKKIKIITNSLYFYRKNNSSITNNFSLDRLERNIKDISNVYSTILKNIKIYNDENLLKLYFSSYLKLMNYYYYKIINNFNDQEKLNSILCMIMNDDKMNEARKILHYRDITFKKMRPLLYFLLKRNKNLYIFSLNILKKLRIKNNYKKF